MAPALIILALWVVLLAPGVVRWCREHQPTTSISSFHRQLRLLEHTGPKIIEPAYRLGGAGVPWRGWMPEVSAPRPPRLVLLPSAASEKELTVRYDDRYEDRYVEHDPEPFVDAYDEWGTEAARDLPRGRHAPMAYRDASTRRFSSFDLDEDVDDALVMTPERARQRRRIILMGLGGVTAATLVFGLIPGLSMLWVVTLLGAVATGSYLGLMYYAANNGMYSRDAFAGSAPVARVVIPGPFAAEDDYHNEGWGYGRVASAR